jgi:hypothetical protein
MSVNPLPTGGVLLYLNMTIVTANDMKVMRNRRFNDNRYERQVVVILIIMNHLKLSNYTKNKKQMSL